MVRWAVGAMWMMAFAGTISAQTAPPPAIAEQDGDSQPGDIIVEGVRLPRDIKATPMRTVPLGTETSAIEIRVKYEFARRVARCAMRLQRDDLRKVVDGAPESPAQQAAQDRLVRQTMACNRDPGAIATPPPMLGKSIYDRGALFEQVLRDFAPRSGLTREQTSDPDVQHRLNTREEPLNRLRYGADKRYFETAICMVRLQPRLSMQLIRTKLGSKLQQRVEAGIIDGARVCVGNAPRVYVDPTQFRIYIADALYRWTVAVLGKPSLIPDS